MKNMIKKYFIIICMFLFCIAFSSCSSPVDAAQNQTIDAEIIPTNISSTATPTLQPTATLEPTATIEPTPTIEPYTEIILGSTGDIMCHSAQLKDAQNAAEGDDVFTKEGNEAYSFDHWFEFIKPSLEYADLMIGNLETTIAVNNSLISGYPFFATPKEILPALKDAGFDVLVNANNHMLDKEQAGLISTVNSVEAAGLYHTGAWTSPESKNIPLVVDVKGIKVGIVSVTCSTNEQDRLLTEEEKSYMFIYMNDMEQVANQIHNCKSAGAEIIIICPHWGTEGATAPNDAIRKLGAEYIKMGADIIFAHHPHVVQPAERIQVTLDDGTTKEGFAFWSLGNFISNQLGNEEKQAGIIGYVKLIKDNNSGEIIIDSASYLPIWSYISYDRTIDTKTYAVLPAGQVLDNPDYIQSLGAPDIKTPLESTWFIMTKRIGFNEADPLRSVPNK